MWACKGQRGFTLLEILIAIPEHENTLASKVRKADFANGAIVKFKPDLVAIQGTHFYNFGYGHKIFLIKNEQS